MLIAISIPIWFAAAIFLLVGIVGSFSSEFRGAQAMQALIMLPVSSGLFYIAARMCGLV